MRISSFKTKIFFYLLVVGLCALFIMGSITAVNNRRDMHENLMQALMLTEQQTCAQIETRLSQVEDVREMMNLYVYRLYTATASSRSQYMDSYSNVKTVLGSLTSTFSTYNMCIFVPQSSLVGSTGVNFFTLDQLERFGMTREELLSNRRQPLWKFSENQNFVWTFKGIYGEQDVLSCWSHYANWITGELFYAYVIHVNVEELMQLIRASHPDNASTSILLNGRGQVVAAQNPTTAQRIMNNLDWKGMMTDGQTLYPVKDCQYLFHRVADHDLYLLTEVDNTYFLNRTPPITSALFSALLLTGLLVLLLTILFSRQITQRIALLSKAILSMKPSCNEPMFGMLATMTEKPQDQKDELDQLATTLVSIQSINDKNTEQLMALTLQEEHLKYQLLQSKINPHFLYNILDSINGCLYTGKIDIAREMTSYLGSFYRQVLRTSRTLIPLAEEVRIAELYLKLEKLCCRDQLLWDIALDDGVEQLLIPKFVLQPILENCIRHGRKQGGDPLHISLTACFAEDELLICIEDNGAGIERQRLSDIQHVLQAHVVSEKQFYGVSNVNQRLIKYFANISNMQITSQQGKGTTVTLHLQQLFEDENGEDEA